MTSPNEDVNLVDASSMGSDALLAAIVRSSTDAIIANDLSGNIMSWNAAATRTFGFSADEMIGAPIRKLLPIDRHVEEGLVFARVAAGDQLAPFDTVRLTASGNRMPVSVTVSPVYSDAGAIIGVAEVFRAPDRRRGAVERGTDNQLQFEMLTDKTPKLTWMAYPGPTDRRTILVVEDEMLIALGLSSMLEAAGFDVIGPAGSLNEAMELLDQHHCALAILDVNLGYGVTSEPVAERLKEAGIPFFVTSAYEPEDRPGIFNDAPSFSKPVGARTIVSAVQAALG